MRKVLLLTDYSSGFSRSFLKGIVTYAKEKGPWVFYRMPEYYRELHNDEWILNWAMEWGADAIIVQLHGFRIDALKKSHIPIVVHSNKTEMSNAFSISSDYYGTGVLAADYFIKKGYTSFAYYGTPRLVWARERERGFIDRVKEFGFQLYEYSEINLKSSGQWVYNPETLNAWLHSLPKPIALFACDDSFALHITEACAVSLIKVPDEVAVLGVDNDELLCDISNPFLSSIILDIQNSGFKLGELLDNYINNGVVENREIRILPVGIQERESTGFLGITDKNIKLIVDYIHQNISTKMTIDDLQELVPLSRRVLEMRFKEIVKMPVYQFIISVRVDLLSDLLINSDKPIFELAPICGFESTQNLSRVFKKMKGLSPLAYRKRFARF